MGTFSLFIAPTILFVYRFFKYHHTATDIHLNIISSFMIISFCISQFLYQYSSLKSQQSCSASIFIFKPFVKVQWISQNMSPKYAATDNSAINLKYKQSNNLLQAFQVYCIPQIQMFDSLIIILFDTNFRLLMLNNPNANQSIGFIEISAENLKSDQVHHINLLQKSEINSKSFGQAENYANLNSYSLKNFIFNFETQDGNQDMNALERESCIISVQDPIFNVLSFLRGKSQYYSERKQIELQNNQFLEEQVTFVDIEGSDSKTERIEESLKQNQSLSSMVNMEEEMSFSKHRGASKITASVQQKKNGCDNKISTKNVTKNMGKLLFRFIWKNKNTLRRQINVSVDKWQKFMTSIKIWKRQNNITREYLINKWHSSDQQSSIFRKISHHFYRKRCLSYIFESKIEFKKMHIDRLKRFEQATWNPKALDSLN